MTCILVPWVTPPTSRAPHLALYFSRRVQTAPVPPAFTLCAHFGSAERDKPDRVIEGVRRTVRNKPTHDRQTGLVLLGRPLCGTRLLAPLLLLLLHCTVHLAVGRGQPSAHPPAPTNPARPESRPDADGSQRWRPGCCQAQSI